MSFAATLARLKAAAIYFHAGYPRNRVLIDRGDLTDLLEDWERLDKAFREQMWKNSP